MMVEATCVTISSIHRIVEDFSERLYRTRIRIICLIALDYRRLNEDPSTMAELTETEECKVTFKREQL